jgi:uncharacterized protein
MSEDDPGEIDPDEIIKTLGKSNPVLSKKLEELYGLIRGYKSAVIAFSGGVDSSLLAVLSNMLLSKALCVVADSPTLPRAELEEAKKFAETHGLNLRIISYSELDDSRFVVNDERRCYYCKDGLFKSLKTIQEEEGYDKIFDGSNFDDLDDYRPGRDAEREHGIVSPFVDAKIGKEEIREISKILGLSTWDKPQMACLSSRVAKGMEITDERLKQIEISEKIIKDLGYKDVRVRHHGDIARIEIGQNEKIDLEALKSIIPQIKKQRFKYVVLDLEGYRTGSLNE